MEAALKVEGGSSHGRHMLVRMNQKVRFGRGELMDFSVPEDGVMSSTHFEVECFSDRCVVPSVPVATFQIAQSGFASIPHLLNGTAPAGILSALGVKHE